MTWHRPGLAWSARMLSSRRAGQARARDRGKGKNCGSSPGGPVMLRTRMVRPTARRLPDGCRQTTPSAQSGAERLARSPTWSLASWN